MENLRTSTAKSVTPAVGTLITTNGTIYSFKRLCVPTGSARVMLYGVELEPGAEATVTLQWEVVARVDMTDPDHLLLLPEQFDAFDTPLIVDGVDVRAQARTRREGDVTVWYTGRKNSRG